jgi:ABC-type sulfate transport system permease component
VFDSGLLDKNLRFSTLVAMVHVVFLKIMAMFLVILAGWFARRHGFLAKEVIATLSVLVVDVAFPALVFTQMLRTVDGPALREGWFTPLLCGLLIVHPQLDLFAAADRPGALRR